MKSCKFVSCFQKINPPSHVTWMQVIVHAQYKTVFVLRPVFKITTWDMSIVARWSKCRHYSPVQPSEYPWASPNHRVNPRGRSGWGRGRRSLPCVEKWICAILKRADYWRGDSGRGSGTTSQSMSCSPTLKEPELTPLRYLEPDTATPGAEEECAQDRCK